MTRHGLTIDDVRPRLLSLDTVRETLATTEPFSTIHVDTGKEIRIILNDGWNHGLEALENNDAVDAYIDIKGQQQLQLTKDSIFAAAKLCDLAVSTLKTYPGKYVEPLFNWGFHERKDTKDFKVLTHDGKYAVAIVRGATQQFSNLQLLDAVLEGIEKKYGKGEVLADYKFTHSLKATRVGLIVPENVRAISGTSVENDTWSRGIRWTSSLIGYEQTRLEGYLFRFTCTNGTIDKRNSDKWDRRVLGQNPDDVYEWARTQVDAIFDGLETSLDHIQAMTQIAIDVDPIDVLKDTFHKFKVSKELQALISANLILEDLTMYGLMQAVTQAANGQDVKYEFQDQMMAIGGELMHGKHELCEGCHRVLPAALA